MTRWRDRAACRSRPTAWWFALPRTAEADLAAKICAECPVIRPCTAHAQANKELGRWGEYARLVEKYRGTRGRHRDFICWGCGDGFLTAAGRRSHQVQKPCGTKLERQVARFERDVDVLEVEVRRAV